MLDVLCVGLGHAPDVVRVGAQRGEHVVGSAVVENDSRGAALASPRSRHDHRAPQPAEEREQRRVVGHATEPAAPERDVAHIVAVEDHQADRKFKRAIEVR